MNRRAGIGAACGISYLTGGGVEEAACTISNAAGILSGMVCNGAKVPRECVYYHIFSYLFSSPRFTPQLSTLRFCSTYDSHHHNRLHGLPRRH